MKQTLADALMWFAQRCSRRHPWLGDAMRAEYFEAQDGGDGLRFALGCAWASLPHRWLCVAVACFVVAPLGVFELGCSWSGIRFLFTGHDHYYAVLMQGDALQQARGEMYRRAGPLITTLLFVIGSGQASLAWSLCRGHWDRARHVSQCVVVAGLTLAALILAVDMGTAVLACYAGIPLCQWRLVRWMEPA